LTDRRSPEVRHAGGARHGNGLRERLRRLIESRLELRSDSHVSVDATLAAYVADGLVQLESTRVRGIRPRRRFGDER
jgi:hypothetical protein